MPVVETQIQHREVIPFFCRKEEEGGLGYRETQANIVNNDLFVPSQLKEFLSVSSPAAWTKLLRKFHGDESALLKSLQAAIRKRMLEATNVAIFFNKNKKIDPCVVRA